jgi:hypothetical protein
MLQAGVQPGPGIFSGLLVAAIRTKNYDKVRHYFQAMVEKVR